jgi:type III secretory pathway lipoprotein EscJ
LAVHGLAAGLKTLKISYQKSAKQAIFLSKIKKEVFVGDRGLVFEKIKVILGPETVICLITFCRWLSFAAGSIAIM